MRRRCRLPSRPARIGHSTEPTATIGAQDPHAGAVRAKPTIGKKHGLVLGVIFHGNRAPSCVLYRRACENASLNLIQKRSLTTACSEADDSISRTTTLVSSR